jgi:NADH-quinone oxidoreductase subunit H
MDTYWFIFKLVTILGTFGFIMGLGFFVTILERKQSALMQDRIGANRAGIPIPFISKKLSLWGIFYNGKLVLWGIINNLADGIKMITKEPFVPQATDRLLYHLALYFAVVPVIALLAVIPFGGVFIPDKFYYAWCPWLKDVMVFIFGGGRAYQLQVANLEIGILFIFAVAGMAIYGAVLGGWSSNNKFSLLGAMRGCAQMISYEIFLGVSMLGVLFIFGTFDMNTLVNKQQGLLFGFLPKWGIIVQPFAFLLFYIAQLAENKRMPFDLPEAESELTLGYHTEYNGMKAGLFVFGEFMETAAVAAVMVALFLGGYHLPWLSDQGFAWPWGGTLNLSHPTVVILRVVTFSAKVVFLIWLQQLVRWTLPRFRYDQVMNLGWKGLLPLALLNLVITVIVVAIWDSLK